MKGHDYGIQCNYLHLCFVATFYFVHDWYNERKMNTILSGLEFQEVSQYMAPRGLTIYGSLFDPGTSHSDLTKRESLSHPGIWAITQWYHNVTHYLVTHYLILRFTNAPSWEYKPSSFLISISSRILQNNLQFLSSKEPPKIPLLQTLLTKCLNNSSWLKLKTTN